MNNLQEQLQPLKNQENLYKKEYKSFEEQLQLLQDRGLIVSNKEYALKKLQHLNYYRLSAYFLPYQYSKKSENKNKFLYETTFEEIIQLYYFDTELRKIMFEAIEMVEIYFRSQISHYHSQSYGAFGYLDINTLRSNFQTEFDELHYDIRKEKDRSKEVFIRHFKKEYNSTDLPIWSVVEIISFGSLSKLFMLLQEKEQNQVIEKLENINKYVFFKWFKALSSVRNMCAHHARVWNRTLGISFEVPRNNRKFEQLINSKNKIFFSLTVLEYILTSIDDSEIDFKLKIKQLFKKYPNIDKKAMGFPKGWKDLDIWT